jgi:mannan endo-1,4-beta-mannosidase
MRGRAWARVAVLVVAAASVVGGPHTDGSGAAPPSAPLAVRGTELVAGAEVVRLTGINAPQAASNYEVGPGCGVPIEAAPLFSAVEPGGLVRVWLTRWLAPELPAGGRDWRAFDALVRAAESDPRAPRLIVTLANQSGACDDGLWKGSAFYRGGWRGDYAAFVREVVGRYAGSPAVAIWEPVNEPEAADCRQGSTGGECYGRSTCPPDAAAVLREFFDVVGAEIHALDPDGLVATGALGGDQCGWAVIPTPANASPEVDVVTFHDYGSEDIPLPDHLDRRLDEAGMLGKPLLVEELGVLGRDDGSCRSTADRAALVAAKVDAAFAAGAAGVLVWAYGAGGPVGCDFFVQPDDPVVPALSGAGADALEPVALAPGPGWWELSTDGDVRAVGSAPDHGDVVDALRGSGRTAVDLAALPDGSGYWILDSAGRVHALGRAPRLGGLPPAFLRDGDVPEAIAPMASGAGYWITTRRGSTVARGDADHGGLLPGLLPAMQTGDGVVDTAACVSGAGYWTVTAAGRVRGVGDAEVLGSARPGHARVVGIVADPDGRGYWLVTADGGVQAFAAPAVGSIRSATPPTPVAGLVPARKGYVLVADDGRAYDLSGGRRGDPEPTPRSPAGTLVAVVPVRSMT